MGNFSLDQFLVFLAVADCGGFAAAGRKLGRAQSAVTHAIRNMEEACGLLLFDRAGYRAVLTDAGKALLPRARQVLAEVDGFRRDSAGYAMGLEASLTLAVDPFAPMAPLVQALSTLHIQFPTVRVRLSTTPHAQVLEQVLAGNAQMGLLAEASPIGTQFASFRWAEQSLMAVAAPDHPLATYARPLGPELLRQHMQVIWSSGGTSFSPQDLGVHAKDCWHVTSLDTKRELLRAGVGWGSMPAHTVAEDLAMGRLVELPVLSWEGRDRMPSFFITVVCLRDSVAGPARRKLWQLLQDSV
ncbi:MAG: LysR family transcriptional regulator [Acidovorax sp.]|nr:LysR family transcriptional regulator [Acidovorax sp.]